jgi:hypothetical protein
MSLITPKNAIEIVLETKTKNATFRLYETLTQKRLFWLSVGCLCAGAFFALVTYAWKNQYVAATAFIFCGSSALLAMAYQIASLVPELLKLRNVEREISSPFLAEFNNDLDLIHELTQTCEIHHLQYAKQNFERMARQLRERIGILVGALDKVGLIPIATTAYFAYLKTQKEGLVAFGGIEWVFVSFVFLYLFAARMTSTAQWMEKVSEIYEQAIALKSKR